MIALLVFAQVAVATAATVTPVPAALTVKGNAGTVEVPILAVATATGVTHAVRADLLATALGGSSHAPKASAPWFTVALPGVTLRVQDHNPYARADSTVVPLDGEPYVVAGQMYLPYAFVTDVLPRVGSGVLFDSTVTELRVFRGLLPGAHSHGSGDVLVADSSDFETSAITGATPGRKHLVVVDAGHGGPDFGMSGPVGSSHPIYEKDITLAVATKVASSLRNRGIQVVMTRTRDTLIALSDRGRIANEAHGDLFVSIHVNAANPSWHDPGAARGFETYFLAEAKTEDARRVADMENEAVRFETSPTGGKNDPLSYIMQDMKQNEHLRESSELAETIERRLGTVHPGPSRGVKQAGFRVLVTAYMPAVLVEIGFGTNASEARFLADPAAQRKLAGAIAGATSEYLTRYERRVGSARVSDAAGTVAAEAAQR
ncbi:MAG TPA: N-acetylmuramoyl-L-alanine amidase [Gemmatimonadaceae bacterium]|nr:N-acetylmuramoyl-L-alanine amidase [Gemmatimonadaceae bacterium]